MEEDAKLELPTPHGKLLFYVSVSAGELGSVELSSANAIPMLPSGMSVDGGFSVLLRCRSTPNTKGLIFGCKWRESREQGFRETGQGIDACGWKQSGSIVMIGTEDDEWLNRRIPRLKMASTAAEYPIKMQNDRIEISIVELLADEALSLHYSVAWKATSAEACDPCFFAVDAPHDWVLAQCRD